MGDYELYHASTRKHKYIKKIGNRYFYTQEELAAYTNGKVSPVAKGDLKYATDVVNNTARREVELANKKRARKESLRAVALTQFAAGEAKRNLKKTSTKRRMRKRVERGKAFLEELLAPPKIGHHTTINSGGNVTEIDTQGNKTTTTRKKKTGVSSMKKQSAKGKKALEKWKKSREPHVEVIQSISEDKNYKRQNGWRG